MIQMIPMPPHPSNHCKHVMDATSRNTITVRSAPTNGASARSSALGTGIASGSFKTRQEEGISSCSNHAPTMSNTVSCTTLCCGSVLTPSIPSLTFWLWLLFRGIHILWRSLDQLKLMGSSPLAEPCSVPIHKEAIPKTSVAPRFALWL